MISILLWIIAIVYLPWYITAALVLIFVLSIISEENSTPIDHNAVYKAEMDELYKQLNHNMEKYKCQRQNTRT